MTYSLSNNCTKNYYNRTLTVQVIVEDVVTWIFFETQCTLSRAAAASDTRRTDDRCVDVRCKVLLAEFTAIHITIYPLNNQTSTQQYYRELRRNNNTLSYNTNQFTDQANPNEEPHRKGGRRKRRRPTTEMLYSRLNKRE